MKAYNYRGIITVFEKVAYSIQEAKLCYGEEEGQKFRIIDNKKGDWGDIYPMTIVTKQTYPLPVQLNLRWLTLVDLKCYETKDALDTSLMEKLWEEHNKQFPEYPFKYVVVGIAPYGGVAVWLRSNINSVFVQQLKAEEVEYDEKEKMVYSEMKGNDEVMALMFPKNHFETVMKQYTYCYVALEEYYDGKQWQWYDSDDKQYESIEIECIEDKRVDGTFDFTDGDALIKYHSAGIPQRIAVRWTQDGKYYFAHFWMDFDNILWLFDSFCKAFPETPIDLLLRLDVGAKRFEVAMTALDLIPRTITGTQFIVFCDGAEYARSEHFTKNDKEWHWE